MKEFKTIIFVINCILIIAVTILFVKTSSTFAQTDRIERMAVYTQAVKGDLPGDSKIENVSIYIPSGPQQSRTGPIPSPEVLKRDAENQIKVQNDFISENSLPVPSYLWRHGCGPTALGMVIGYYDVLGYDDLIPGSAVTQTDQVNQAIASGGDQNNPFPSGLESHYEDYARPQDSWPVMLDDDYITQGREPHTDNCIADYMHTSKSTFGNYYGWCWSDHMGSAFVDYVLQQNSNYSVEFQDYYFHNGTLNWSILTSEIDLGRPMVFLVDTNGDDTTDHFVTVVDYRTHGPHNEYGCWDTWDDSKIRWEDFNQMSAGVPWGIWGAWKFVFNTPVPVELTKFTAYTDGDKVILNWTTATEVKNYGFDIERSIDNREWQRLGFIEGHGNSNSPKSYSFDDMHPIGGSMFKYRLKQIDTDGKFEYSDIVEVEIVPTKFALLQNYPNPFNSTTVIRYSLPQSSSVEIFVFNIIGEMIIREVIENQVAGNYEWLFTVNELSSGTYFYQLQAGSFAETKKMILLK
jgi:hypothetical protein